MSSPSAITAINAMEILDSRGNPTLQVRVTAGQATGEAMVPSGASTGTYEAHELRDGDKKRYLKKGVLKACAAVSGPIAIALRGADVLDQSAIDHRLIDLDGTANKTKLGANAILGVSLAVARAAAHLEGKPLYQSLGGPQATVLPVPLLNVLNGGAHATNGLDIQEFMLVPAGFGSFREALRAGVEVYHTLKDLLKADGLATGLGDEGGFAPVLGSHEAVLTYLADAIAKAGYTLGKDIWLALDCAASEYYKTDHYAWQTLDNATLEPDQLLTRYAQWARDFHLISIEDPYAEDDWTAWQGMTTQMGGEVQIVGDDLLVTNPTRLAEGLRQQACNAILIKLNQIGTLTETRAVIATAQAAGWGIVISHRSGETSDTFISDLAVAVNAGQIKTGAPARGERVAKYNRLLEIEADLGSRAVYRGKAVYERFLGTAPAAR